MLDWKVISIYIFNCTFQCNCMSNTNNKCTHIHIYTYNGIHINHAPFVNFIERPYARTLFYTDLKQSTIKKNSIVKIVNFNQFFFVFLFINSKQYSLNVILVHKLKRKKYTEIDIWQSVHFHQEKYKEEYIIITVREIRYYTENY